MDKSIKVMAMKQFLIIIFFIYLLFFFEDKTYVESK